MAESDSDDMVIDVEAADFKERCEKAKVPADLPLRFVELWLKFSEAPFPVCEFNPGTLDVPQGFYLKYQGNDLRTYAGLLTLKFKDNELYTVCRMAG